jgi:hypothetical protein
VRITSLNEPFVDASLVYKIDVQLTYTNNDCLHDKKPSLLTGSLNKRPRLPPSHARAREMATRILRMNGDDQPLGKRWINKFIRDNSRVASVIGRPVEAARVNGTNPDAIQEFFSMYQDAVLAVVIVYIDQIAECRIEWYAALPGTSAYV